MVTKARSSILVALIVSFTIASGISAAGDAPKEGKNSDDSVEAKVPADPNAEALRKLAVAYSLVNYGRTSKSPEALITAARMLSEISTSPLDAKPTSEQAPDAPASEEKKAREGGSVEPAALLAEAKSMSGDDPHIVAVADRIRLSRGAVGGPKLTIERVSAYSTDSYKIAFRGSELAVVMLSGDGDTDLDLYVYDEGGNLIAADTDYSDDCIASWVPRWTGAYTIRVRNRGNVYNRYTIGTN